MTQQAGEPNAEQLTIWRNLLDAIGQLQASWDVAVRAQHSAEPGAGPGTVHMPEELIKAFAEYGGTTAAILEGLAQVLAEQPGHSAFSAVPRASKEARRQWQAAREQLDLHRAGDDGSGAAGDTSGAANANQ